MGKDIKEVEKYYKTQQQGWQAFRIFWFIIALLLIAAAAGLFGDGVLSTQTHKPPGLEIKYQKFMRMGKDTDLQIYVRDLGPDPVVRINNDYLKKVRISQVIPEPAAIEIQGNTLVYHFHPIRHGFITFYLSPQQMGSQKLALTVAGEHMHVYQYIYF